MTIQAELCEITKVVKKDGEGQQPFLRRLFEKVNDLEDDDWKKLSNDAQEWCNNAADAIKAKSALPSLNGGSNGADAGEEVPKPKGKKASKSAKAAAPKKEAAAKAPAKAKTKAKADGQRGREGPYALDSKITLVVKDNPKRAGTKAHKLYAKYKNGMTVGEALKAGFYWTYLQYDVGKNNIAIK